MRSWPFSILVVAAWLVSLPCSARDGWKPPKQATVWIGVSGALDFLSLPAGDDLCLRTPGGASVSGEAVYCTTPGGADFPDTPAENARLVPGAAGHWNGGITTGNVRVLLSGDVAVHPSILLGLRAGYVMNTFPGEAYTGARPFGRHLHLEARGTYVFGSHPLSVVGFAPMVFAGFGISEFDGHLRSNVMLSGAAGRFPMEVWIIGGPYFAMLGGGLRYQFSLRSALTLAVRANTAFGDPGFLFTGGPELGVQYGF
jgi:hypothetical protein